MYGFSDLVLLVGTNPVPNYVLAKYFLKSNPNLKKIWLVHSETRDDIGQEGTDWLAKDIKEVLTNEFQGEVNFNFCSLRDVSSAKEIERNIKQKLVEKLTQDAKIHLDYTGGTKVMSVHIHRVLNEKLKNKVSFSYLDVRTFCLKDDKRGKVTNDLRKEIDISLENLMKLHGYKREKPQKDGKKINIEQIKQHISCGELREIGGSEFEKYVYTILKKRIEEENLVKNTPIDINWQLKKIDGKKTFELDVILINGYQVCGISCTTSGKESRCKSKGFEVLHRVNQIGGEEAKAILITGLPKEELVEEMGNDLKTITGSDDEKLLVLGIEDLKEEDILWKKIKGFVWKD